MFVNYFLTAVRSFMQHKHHFVLNVLGFSIGMAAAILVALFAYNELNVDKDQPDADRVYRVYADNTAVGLSKDGAISAEVPLTLKSHSHVESIMLLVDTYFINGDEHELPDIVRVANTEFKLGNFYVASPNLMDFVNLEVIDGRLDHVLEKPGYLALSRSEAMRLFGTVNVIGQTLTHEAGIYRIGAVFEDLPQNTHFAFNVLTFLPETSRGPFGAHVYFKLTANADELAIEAEMTEERRRRSPRWGDTSFDLIPLSDVHFNSNGEFEMKQGGSLIALKISILLSTLLVVIASVNFINLNIASAGKRAKEIGVRKALGATRAQLITQFLTESLLLVLVAGLFALFLVELSLPGFNQVVERNLSIEYGSPFMWSVMNVVVFIGLLSGLYPALFLSAFSAKRVLSGDLSRGQGAIWVRKLTLCLQGAFSVGLMVAVLFLYGQMTLIKELDVGYAKQDRLIIRELPAEVLYNKEPNVLMNALSNLVGIQGVSLSDTNYATSMLMGQNFTWPNGETLDGMQPNIVTGYHAADVLGLTLLAGRDFSPEFAGDWYVEDANGEKRAGVLVTRSQAQAAGYTDFEQVVGMTLTVPRRNLTATVVGVVEDIRLGSVTKPVLPSSFILGYIRNETGNIILNTETENRVLLTQQVNEVLRQHISRNDVKIDWIEEEFHQAHRNEFMTLTVLTIFCPLAIFLTCLGTVGLASFATFRRQKEVAMRKVLGASRLNIVNLLAKEFLVLVVVSWFIAFPATYFLIADWLANFNERISQSLWVYLVSAVLIAVITWITVAGIAFKTASTRPSKILRYE